MRIQQTNHLGRINPYQKQHQDQQQDMKTSKRNGGKQQDEVQISTEAKQLAADTSVQHDKVAALKRAVANGTYEIDAQQLAEKIWKHFNS